LKLNGIFYNCIKFYILFSIGLYFLILPLSILIHYFLSSDSPLSYLSFAIWQFRFIKPLIIASNIFFTFWITNTISSHSMCFNVWNVNFIMYYFVSHSTIWTVFNKLNNSSVAGASSCMYLFILILSIILWI